MFQLSFAKDKKLHSLHVMLYILSLLFNAFHLFLKTAALLLFTLSFVFIYFKKKYVSVLSS